MSSAGAPPTVLGRYELGVPLGGGPTGSIYRARLAGVAGFAREYAVKVFHPSLVASASSRERLTAGLRTAQGLMHPRIVRLHEQLTIDGWLLAASELIHGVDLGRLVTMTAGMGHPLPPGAMLFVITQIARTLGYAHGRNAAHLGLCPTNVMALPDGDLKVTDFSILPARLQDSPADDRTLAARLPYLAPEQLVGARSTPAIDVFELGVLAYELFTGERAFAGGGGVEVAARIMAGSPRDAPIPAAVRDVLRKALSPRGEDRFADGAAMAGALDAVALRAALPGGRLDVAAAVKRLLEQSASQAAAEQGSGAVTMPLPAPPMPSPPDAPFSRRHVTITTDVTKLPTRVGGTTPPQGSGPGILPSTTRTTGAPPPIPGEALGVQPRAGRVAVEPGLALDADVLRQDTLRGVGSPEEIRAGRTAPIVAEPSFEDGLSPEDLETYRGELIDLTPPPGDKGTNGRAAGAAARAPALPADDAIPLIDPFAEAPSGPKTSRVDPLPSPGGGPLSDRRVELTDELSDAEDEDGGRAHRGRALALLGVLAVAAGGVAAVYFVKPELLPLELFGLERTPDPRGRAAVPATPDAARVTAVAAVAIAGTDAVVAIAPGPDAAAALAVAVPDAVPVVAIPTLPPDAARPPAPPDAARVAVVVPDAARPKPVVPVPVVPPVAVVVPPVPSGPVSEAKVTPGQGALAVTSTPPGAFVYLDGALKGTTPLELPASGDRHKLAVLKAGHVPYKAEVDGSGKVTITLPKAEIMRGPAGLRVVCKTTDRIYIYLDGKPTGRLCTGSRIHVTLGPHTIELYDPVTDATTTHQIDAKSTSHSVKLKTDQ